jgi:hypothetical protein
MPSMAAIKQGLDRLFDIVIDLIGFGLIALAVAFALSPTHSNQAGAMVTAAGLFGVGRGIRRRGNP